MPELRQIADQIEDGQVPKLHKVIVTFPISRISDHAHDPKKQHQQEDHETTNTKTDAHVPVGLRGEDALPRALIEELRGDDRDPERHQGFEAFREPAGRVVELFLGNLRVYPVATITTAGLEPATPRLEV